MKTNFKSPVYPINPRKGLLDTDFQALKKYRASLTGS